MPSVKLWKWNKNKLALPCVFTLWKCNVLSVGRRCGNTSLGGKKINKGEEDDEEEGGGNTRRRRWDERRWSFKCQTSVELMLQPMPRAVSYIYNHHIPSLCFYFSSSSASSSLTSSTFPYPPFFNLPPRPHPPTSPHLPNQTPFLPLSCHPTALHPFPPSISLPPPCCLLIFLSHLFRVYLFLNHMSFSFTLRPTLPPSVPPLCGDMNWCVSWVDHSLQLLSAKRNSLSLMCHCDSFSLPLCLSLSLSPPRSFPPSFTLSCLLPSLSLSFLPSHLCSHPLYYFPLRQACQEDSTTCPRAVWCCSVWVRICASAARYVEHTFVFVCVSDRERVRESVCVP